MGPASSLKADQSRQIRIAFQQWREGGINPPENFPFSKMLFEQTQHGQGLNDITKRAGFENEDFQIEVVKWRKNNSKGRNAREKVFIRHFPLIDHRP